MSRGGGVILRQKVGVFARRLYRATHGGAERLWRSKVMVGVGIAAVDCPD